MSKTITDVREARDLFDIDGGISIFHVEACRSPDFHDRWIFGTKSEIAEILTENRVKCSVRESTARALHSLGVPWDFIDECMPTWDKLTSSQSQPE